MSAIDGVCNQHRVAKRGHVVHAHRLCAARYARCDRGSRCPIALGSRFACSARQGIRSCQGQGDKQRTGDAAKKALAARPQEHGRAAECARRIQRGTHVRQAAQQCEVAFLRLCKAQARVNQHAPRLNAGCLRLRAGGKQLRANLGAHVVCNCDQQA